MFTNRRAAGQYAFGKGISLLRITAARASHVCLIGILPMNTAKSIEHFAGGAKRSDRKPRFDLIPFVFLEAVAQVLRDGALKYGAHNWQRGSKDFFLDTWNHAFVHLQKVKEGDTSEDHLAHFACNVAFLIWAVRKGVLQQTDFSFAPTIGHGASQAGGTRSLDCSADRRWENGRKR